MLPLLDEEDRSRNRNSDRELGVGDWGKPVHEEKWGLLLRAVARTRNYQPVEGPRRLGSERGSGNKAVEDVMR